MKASEIKVGQVLAMRRSKYESPTRVTVLAVGYLRRYADVPFTMPDGTQGTIRAAAKDDHAHGYGTGNPVHVVTNGERLLLAESRDLIGDYDAVMEERRAASEARQARLREQARKQSEHLDRAESLLGSLDGLIPAYSLGQYRKGHNSHVGKDVDTLMEAGRRAVAQAGVLA